MIEEYGQGWALVMESRVMKFMAKDLSGFSGGGTFELIQDAT